MNLIQLLEQEEINEGLLIFKKSNKIKNHIFAMENKLKSQEIPGVLRKGLSKLIEDAKEAAEEHKKIEDAFDEKKLTRKEAKSRLQALEQKYDSVLNQANKYKKQQALKAIAGGVLVLALVGFSEVMTNVRDAIQDARSNQTIERVIKE